MTETPKKTGKSELMGKVVISGRVKSNFFGLGPWDGYALTVPGIETPNGESEDEIVGFLVKSFVEDNGLCLGSVIECFKVAGD
jgi:hypothetical protein